MTNYIEDRLLKLAEKATPGPWEAQGGQFFPSVEAPSRTREEARNGNTLVANVCAINGESNAALIASCSPEVVAAMCRVVAAAREDLLECHACYCDEAWRGRGLHAPECKFDEVDDLRSALAALDAMEGKA